MTFRDGIGDRAINEVIREHPDVGAVLQKYEIGCVTCSVGICLLKDVVSIHGLPKDVEDRIEAEINALLSGHEAGRKEK
ncbi:MAG: hypothetical protein HY900_00020 [Deltaproteobacteria bacterium]|nr:hypothetical protein [Deltaproteobacteria bacterium]